MQNQTKQQPEFSVKIKKYRKNISKFFNLGLLVVFRGISTLQNGRENGLSKSRNQQQNNNFFGGPIFGPLSRFKVERFLVIFKLCKGAIFGRAMT
jgi:hypothetical protein